MSDWLRSLIGEPVKEYTQFEAGLCLLAALPPGDAIDRLKRREQRLEDDFQQLRAGLDQVLATGLPPLFLVEAEYRLSRMDAERQFVRSLLRRIDDEGWAASPAWSYLHEARPQLEGKEKPGRAEDPQAKTGELAERTNSLSGFRLANDSQARSRHRPGGIR